MYHFSIDNAHLMRVIYTSKGMSKKVGVRVIYRKIRYFLNIWYRCHINGHKNGDHSIWSVQYLQSLFYKNRLLCNTDVNMICSMC
jgi:hypothetical protein